MLYSSIFCIKMQSYFRKKTCVKPILENTGKIKWKIYTLYV